MDSNASLLQVFLGQWCTCRAAHLSWCPNLRAFFLAGFSLKQLTPLICAAPYTLLVLITLADCSSKEETKDNLWNGSSSRARPRTYSWSQFEKSIFPPGSCFLRKKFPNKEFCLKFPNFGRKRSGIMDPRIPLSSDYGEVYNKTMYNFRATTLGSF